jgi:UDP-glucose 4-epimerase
VSRILITGGNGFIGANLVDALAALQNHHLIVFDLYPRPYDTLPENVIFVQGSLHDDGLINRTLIDEDVDVVFHLAWTTIHETALKNPVEDLEQNLIATVKLIGACNEARVKRLIYVSSGGTVYGIPQRLPVDEEHPTNPINPYGVSKLAAEKYLQMYGHLFGLDYVIFRPSVPYGPYQNPHRRQGAVTVFLYRAMTQEPIVIWGDGEIVRDYFYISDLVDALVAAIDLPPGISPVINLAGDRGYSLNQLVEVIKSSLNMKVQVRYEAARKFDIPVLHLSSNTAQNLLGWQPKISLETGIATTYQWLKRQFTQSPGS